MDNIIIVNKYNLSPKQVFIGTQYTYGIDTISFQFDDVWNGLVKKISFYPNGIDPFSLDVVDGVPIPIPEILSQSFQQCNFVLSGYKSGVEIVSAIGNLYNTGTLKPVDDVPPPAPVGSIYVKTTATYVPYIRYNNDTVEYSLDGATYFNINTITSVNGKVGDVVLTATDVGALPDTTFIPTKTSQLINDSDFVSDANYIHTDNNFTTAYKNQIDTNTNNIENLNTTKANQTDLTAEITNRTNADNNLQAQITTNTNNIANEIANRENADNDLQTQITDNADAITNEITNRQNEDAILNGQIESNLNLITELQRNKANQTDLNAEISNRTNADNNLQNQINELSGMNEWIGSIPTCVVGEEQTTLTAFVVATVSRQPRQGDQVTIVDRNQIWMYNGKLSTWKLWLDGSLADATISNKGVVQIGSGINVANGVISTDKSTIGLGNVPNVTTNNQTPTWTISSVLANLVSGEALNIAFGKIAQAIQSLISHIANTSNPHNVTKAQMGLGDVDNTSDIDKPISKDVQDALDNGVNLYASGLWKKTTGASNEVYSASGSDLDITLNGKTIQPGTGDPSPTNIRPIYGVGQYDKKIVLDGNEQSSYAVADYGDNIRFLIVPPNYSVNYTGATTQCFGNTLEASYLKTIGIDNTMIINKPAFYCHSSGVFVSFSKSNGILTVTRFKEYLSTHPLTIYYQSTSYAAATQVYCGLSITDANGYHGYAAGPMAPLYDGDTLDFVSGKCIRNKYRKIFDNSAVITWGELNVTTPKGASPYSNASGFGLGSVCNTFAQGASKSFMGTSPSQTGPVYIWRTAYLASLGITTKEQLTAALSSNQMVVVYPISPTTETVAISEPIQMPTHIDKYTPYPAVVATPESTLVVGYNMDGLYAYNTLSTAIAALGAT